MAWHCTKTAFAASGLSRPACAKGTNKCDVLIFSIIIIYM